MTNRNPDFRYERPEQAVPWAIEQWVKQNIHTVLPGIVEAYNSDTKRAKVKPAISTMLMNPEDSSVTSREKPPIINVPVRQVSTGGYMVHQALSAGDVVILLFSERGIDQFKQNWGSVSKTDMFSFFSMRDAFAIPWGKETVIPVSDTAWVVQNESGTSYIEMEGNDISLVAGNSSISIVNGTITIRSPALVFEANTINDRAYS